MIVFENSELTAVELPHHKPAILPIEELPFSFQR
jgi:hypothetical protein